MLNASTFNLSNCSVVRDEYYVLRGQPGGLVFIRQTAVNTRIERTFGRRCMRKWTGGILHRTEESDVKRDCGRVSLRRLNVLKKIYKEQPAGVLMKRI